MPMPMPMPMLLLSRRLTRCCPPPRPPRLCCSASALASSASAGPRARANTTTTTSTTTLAAAASPTASPNDSGDALHTARTWLNELHAQTIPIAAIGELTFSRSSGPGGQNVNKVNSKATLKVPIDALLRHVPAALHGDIKRSRYYAANSAALVVHADDSRKQSDNVRSCFRRLHDAIVDAARKAVPAQASPEQAHRVKLLYVFVAASVSDSPRDGPKADKTPVKNPITSAA
ncbi:hypothetical protein ACJBU6_11346 [Exserohilum turcicum]